MVQTASSLLDEHTREAIQLFDTISLLKRCISCRSSIIHDKEEYRPKHVMRGGGGPGFLTQLSMVP
mgnify:CR=1 FL=1